VISLRRAGRDQSKSRRKASRSRLVHKRSVNVTVKHRPSKWRYSDSDSACDESDSSSRTADSDSFSLESSDESLERSQSRRAQSKNRKCGRACRKLKKTKSVTRLKRKTSTSGKKRLAALNRKTSAWLKRERTDTDGLGRVATNKNVPNTGWVNRRGNPKMRDKADAPKNKLASQEDRTASTGRSLEKLNQVDKGNETQSLQLLPKEKSVTGKSSPISNERADLAPFSDKTMAPMLQKLVTSKSSSVKSAPLTNRRAFTNESMTPVKAQKLNLQKIPNESIIQAQISADMTPKLSEPTALHNENAVTEVTDSDGKKDTQSNTGAGQREEKEVRGKIEANTQSQDEMFVASHIVLNWEKWRQFTESTKEAVLNVEESMKGPPIHLYDKVAAHDSENGPNPLESNAEEHSEIGTMEQLPVRREKGINGNSVYEGVEYKEEITQHEMTPNAERSAYSPTIPCVGYEELLYPMKTTRIPSLTNCCIEYDPGEKLAEFQRPTASAEIEHLKLTEDNQAYEDLETVSDEPGFKTSPTHRASVPSYLSPKQPKNGGKGHGLASTCHDHKTSQHCNGYQTQCSEWDCLPRVIVPEEFKVQLPTDKEAQRLSQYLSTTRCLAQRRCEIETESKFLSEGLSRLFTSLYTGATNAIYRIASKLEPSKSSPSGYDSSSMRPNVPRLTNSIATPTRFHSDNPQRGGRGGGRAAHSTQSNNLRPLPRPMEKLTNQAEDENLVWCDSVESLDCCKHGEKVVWSDSLNENICLQFVSTPRTRTPRTVVPPQNLQMSENNRPMKSERYLQHGEESRGHGRINNETRKFTCMKSSACQEVIRCPGNHTTSAPMTAMFKPKLRYDREEAIW